jgi:hypothetical protein
MPIYAYRPLENVFMTRFFSYFLMVRYGTVTVTLQFYQISCLRCQLANENPVSPSNFMSPLALPKGNSAAGMGDDPAKQLASLVKKVRSLVVKTGWCPGFP